MKTESSHRRLAVTLGVNMPGPYSENVETWILTGEGDYPMWSRHAEALATAEHRGASTRALELWAMDVLDAWAEMQLCDSPAGHHTTDVAKADDGTVGWCLHTAGGVSGVHLNAPSARITAARALKAAHPELPDEPKGSE
jgi:hypothetical protein